MPEFGLDGFCLLAVVKKKKKAHTLKCHLSLKCIHLHLGLQGLEKGPVGGRIFSGGRRDSLLRLKFLARGLPAGKNWSLVELEASSDICPVLLTSSRLRMVLTLSLVSRATGLRPKETTPLFFSPR